MEGLADSKSGSVFSLFEMSYFQGRVVYLLPNLDVIIMSVRFEYLFLRFMPLRFMNNKRKNRIFFQLHDIQYTTASAVALPQ